MNEQLIKTIKELKIKKAPEEQSLDSAIPQYTKKALSSNTAQSFFLWIRYLQYFTRHDFLLLLKWLLKSSQIHLSRQCAPVDHYKKILQDSQFKTRIFQWALKQCSI